MRIDIFSNINPPKTNGIYFFKSHINEIVYIGKAKNLYKRIFSYNTNKQIDWKIAYLLQKSTEIGWIETKTENDALILEAELISIHKPIFNKLLTSDTPFYYLIFLPEQKQKNILPSLIISRIKKSQAIFQIGPFLKKNEALTIQNMILEQFHLFTCNKKIEHGCLDFHIGRCAGTCKLNFDTKEYNKNFLTALQAIKNPITIIKKIEKQIKYKKKCLDINGIEKLIQLEHAIHTLNKMLSFSLSHQSVQNFYEEEIKETINQINTKNKNTKIAILELIKLFQINKKPENIIIDCIDVSHLQGLCTTGASVRFINGIFDKKTSKAYTLENNINNDYENLSLTTKKHYIDSDIAIPDIILIDGGIGQLKTIYKNLPLQTHLIALAKKEETLFFLNKNIKKLDIHSPIGQLLINIRNTAHRTALSLHQKLRNQQFA